jgi:hypothetical protein
MEDKKIRLKWLGKTPSINMGVTWGIPWKQGELKRNENLSLADENGKVTEVATWPTAYWPDGSVKWTAHSANFNSEATGQYFISKGDCKAAESRINIKDENDFLQIDTGSIKCEINKSGSAVIKSIYKDKELVCSGGNFICIKEEQGFVAGCKVTKEQAFESNIMKVSIENQSSIRCVVKIEGNHKLVTGTRQWLPFVLRLYFYVEQASIKAIYTFSYDGNENMDFIKGIGLNLNIPMKGELYNRHLRFSGDTGLFKEAPKHLMTIRTQGKYAELYRRQTSGEYISFDEEEDSNFLSLIEESALWNNFKLVQNSPDYYSIKKRTKDGCSWIKAGEGNRSKGLVYAGGEKGGIATVMKNFWQRYPAGLELDNMATEEANMKLWFWSPDGEVMDFRHYDTEPHVLSSYEGFDEIRSTAYGISNTSEFNIYCFENTPDNDTLLKLVDNTQEAPLLVCEPKYYYEVKAFGAWSLIDRSNKNKSMLEDQLEGCFEFIKDEIEARRWYGFWDFGDVMHSYDPIRHTWRYDIGGCAWQNTELVPNMWLWYMFLRSGREDIFRVAEAMTRHTSEVDIYHFGQYSGLGSRHNVLHWGCSCKEARISMAGLHRFYYYFTADERVGEIMDFVKDSDYALESLDPLRTLVQKDEYTTHARSGPDWMAFSSNWFTRWERFEDEYYKNKLIKGINFFKELPHGLLSGNIFGYDAKTNELSFIKNNNGTHFLFCFGNSQVWIEISQAIKDEKWEELLYQLGEFYSLSKEEQRKRTNGEIPEKGFTFTSYATALAAYTAGRTNNKELAKKVWNTLLLEKGKCWMTIPMQVDDVDEKEYIKPVKEIPWIQSNTLSQWSLNVIMALEFIGDELPEDINNSQVPTAHA